MTTPDRDVVRRMLAGDVRAFDEFVNEYSPRLYRFALVRLHNNPDAAEDVVQATLCKVISKLATYRGEAALFTWLCTFCRHEISAHFGRLRKTPPTVELAEQDADTAGVLESLWTLAEHGPERQLQRRELERLVHVVLDRLPGHYADALEWKYIDAVSVNDIAARLALSPKAAESLLTRARSAFRDGFTALVGPAVA